MNQEYPLGYRSRAAFALFIVFLVGAFARGITLPSGFTDELVATVGAPTALAFTPDGRLLITTQPGQLRVFQNGALVATAALNLATTGAICSNSERGLLGVAVDPAFTPTSNNFIYLYYTFNKSGVCEQNTSRSPVNRVSRFTLPSTNVIDPESNCAPLAAASRALRCRRRTSLPVSSC